MKLAVIAFFSLVVGFIAANLLYPNAAGRVSLAIAALLFAFLAPLTDRPRTHRSR